MHTTRRQFISTLVFTFFSSLWLSAHASLTPQPLDSVFVTPEWTLHNQQNILLIDVSSQASYQKSHLENALWMNYDWLIKPQNGLALSGGTSYMSKVLSQLGVTLDTHIVLYDDMGNLNVSRLYWELKKLKHHQVNILDGGTVAWILKGFQVTQTLPQPRAKTIYSAPEVDLTNALTADKADILKALKDPAILLIDSRSHEEYVGHPKQKRSGHLPGAIFFEWSLAVDFQNGFRQVASNQLLTQLKTLGIADKQQRIIVYCNSGHRAARVMTMLDSLGFIDIKLYDGSMQEYAIDNSLPLRLGELP